MKKTPLKRKTPLRVKKPWRPERKPLPRRSKKTQKLYKEQRIPLVKKLLSERLLCQAKLKGCARRSVDLHEVRSRGRGGSITDETNILVVCRNCHRRIGEHPKEAVELGLLKHSWDS